MLRLLLFALFHSCTVLSQSDVPQAWEERTRIRIQKRLENFKPVGRPPKNVIFFLGDGMGLPAVTVARMYKGEKLNQTYENLPFSFEEFQFSSLIKTSSFNKHVTDSAASAVALFTGYKIDQEMLGTLPGRPSDCSIGTQDQIHDGIAELALRRGMSVGFVTTDKITGATPAALYAKGVERNLYCDVDVPKFGPLCEGKDIASQLLQYPANQFKVLMGGGSDHFLPAPAGQREDGRDIATEWKNLGGNRVLINSTTGLDSLDPRLNSQVLGLFSRARFPFYIDEVAGKTRTVPRLKELAEKAVQILERDNPNGYWLMIEGGNIDIGEHINQMRVASEELFEFDEAIKRTLEIVNPEETLLLVTADHSHALALPGYLNKNASAFGNGKIENQLEEDPPVPGIFFAVGPGASQPLQYSSEDSAAPHFASPAAIHAKLGSHGGEDVGLWAEGPYSWLFSGTMENSEVAHVVKQVLCLYPNRAECIIYRKHESFDEGGLSTVAIWIAVLSLIVAILSTILSLVLLSKDRNKVYN